MADPEDIPALEQDLEDYPDERGEIITELADAYRRSGEYERAERLLRELVDDPGEDSQFARSQLAELYFDLNRPDDAHAELAELWASLQWSSHKHVAELPAELLEERGDLNGALTWFELVTSSFTSEDLDAARGELGWMTPAGRFIRARRRVRTQLGLDHDELDRVMPLEEDILGARGGLHAVESEGPPDTPAEPGIMRVLYWPRAELAAATSRWPDLLETETSDPEHYFPHLQRKWRHAVEEQGVTRVELVPADVASMAAYAERTGGDVHDEETRRAYTAERYVAGHVLPWPPERNAPCWCGSGSKYKKCCGHPSRQ